MALASRLLDISQISNSATETNVPSDSSRHFPLAAASIRIGLPTCTLGPGTNAIATAPSVDDTNPVTRRVNHPNRRAKGTKVSTMSRTSITSLICVALPAARLRDSHSRMHADSPTSLNSTIVEIGRSQWKRESNSSKKDATRRRGKEFEGMSRLGKEDIEDEDEGEDGWNEVRSRC